MGKTLTELTQQDAKLLENAIYDFVVGMSQIERGNALQHLVVARCLEENLKDLGFASTTETACAAVEVNITPSQHCQTG